MEEKETIEVKLTKEAYNEALDKAIETLSNEPVLVRFKRIITNRIGAIKKQ